jgi:hypothetical protein
MYIQYFHCIHPLTLFLHLLPAPTSTNIPSPTPPPNLFCPPVLWFCKRRKKNDIFVCLR